ncbi:MAG: alpha-L-fucosidase [Candidatus Hydrogenedens sp.]|nr:alpha-L-fucosidase [Candidatus Hydrogenedentota bacterium]NLF56012.1 alpha-L-fucosidase [Candidatus Hydrogenedens sp.]
MTTVMLGLLVVASTLGAAEPPAPHGVTPSERLLKWHELEFYGFLHFTINTFTDKEWGYGDESPSLFNPADFDADQIAGAAREAGMTGLILTCKHHDGFCLWPSKHTDHSVAASPWRDGKGDVVREISDACRRHGLKFGVYLSPWDRNHPDYGRPAYVEYFRNQLRELLTNYGPIFEVWFDGANGGDGWYGGAKETRNIDRNSYYDWDNTWAIVRELQPDAVMFSDVGPDIRWVGNEAGYAGDPCWAAYTPRGRDGQPPCPGQTEYKDAENGTRDGIYWMPAEVDVSIRPGWFYHEKEDRRVRKPDNLKKLYFESVGRGASFLLNLPPDRRGRIHENDLASLRAFGAWRRATFGKDLARDAKAAASNVRGGDPRYAPGQTLDGDRSTYWCVDDGVLTPELTLDLGEKKTFDVVSLREYLPLGQRVDEWALDRLENGAWAEFARGASIGSRRLWHGEPVTTDKVRLRIVKAAACPAIAEFALHLQAD